jgi:general secretion pathway protein G
MPRPPGRSFLQQRGQTDVPNGGARLNQTMGSISASPTGGPFAEPPRPARDDSSHGFTLIELMIVAAIVGALAALAIPNLQRALEQAQFARAIGDIDAIQQTVQEFYLDNNSYPATLEDVGMGGLTDPWGNAYVYLRVADAAVGQLRKDRFLVPINSDFDLYSMGPDGQSRAPLLATPSRDDIIRANDGGFVGIAAEF